MPRKKQYEDRVCKICEEVFTTEISNKRGRDRKTCGKRKCQDKLRLETTYEKKCVICEKQYTTVRINSKFCSDTCRKKRVKKNCEACNSEFRTDRPEIKFCSPNCISVGLKKVEKITNCDYCDSEIKRSANHIFKSKNNFCDSTCCNNYWGYKLFSGKSKYGGYWGTVRKNTLEYYNGSCQKCNCKVTLKNCNIHHIIPIKYFKEEEKHIANSIENLIPLCLECHKDVHKQNNKWYEINFETGKFLKI